MLLMAFCGSPSGNPFTVLPNRISISLSGSFDCAWWYVFAGLLVGQAS